MQAQPLSDDLSKDIDLDQSIFNQENDLRSKIFADKYDWDAQDATKIWCFGPDSKGPNILVNKT